MRYVYWAKLQNKLSFRFYTFVSILLFLLFSSLTFAQEPKVLGKKNENSTKAVAPGLGEDFVGKNFRKEPTYIDSNILTVQTEKRIFVYQGSVKVVQADMTLTCEELEGHYNEQNKIEELIAKKNVEIIKGPTIKARGQKAVYNAKTAIVTLTDNPSLEQVGSTLSADVIKVFLDENRSVAEGTVRVKVASTEQPTPIPTAAPTSGKK